MGVRISMFQATGRSPKRRSKPSYIYSIVSISLVLFVIGLLGTFLFQAQYLTRTVKEKIAVQIELKDNLSETDIFQFVKRMEGEKYVKSASYVSKEEAAKILQEDLGEDFLDLLGYNPLYASVDLNLNADFVNADSLSIIVDELSANSKVQNLHYQKTLVNALDKNIGKITLGLGVVGALLFFIALTLIDNTIRLAMFSNRFLIKSMQLVGATRWFIVRPFILKGITNGLLSGIIAALAMLGLFIALEKQIDGLTVLQDLLTFALVVGTVVSLGIVISLLSTQRAVSKYLNLKLDDLY